jgi:type 1 glutamine amidotransferase
MTAIKDVALICAGKYHDIDFARLELLKLFAELPHVRVSVHSDYALGDILVHCDAIVSYTCDVVATEAEAERLQAWLQAGGRWFALHGTNSVIEFVSSRPLKVATPDTAPHFMRLLGSQFQAHPPICEFDVKVTDATHPLTNGIDAFTTTDEIYLCRMLGDNQVLLHCEFSQPVDDFVSTDWQANDTQPVMYLHPHSAGEVLYLTLGHCRGHFDMRPLTDYYPNNERCSWDTPAYYELLRRGLRWAVGEL